MKHKSCHLSKYVSTDVRKYVTDIVNYKPSPVTQTDMNSCTESPIVRHQNVYEGKERERIKE